MNTITLAITNWKRANYLDRCLAAAYKTGFENVVVSSSEPDEQVGLVLEKYQHAFGDGMRVSTSPRDRTCHGEWINAAYHSPTERIIIMHDDDVVCREFNKAYRELIKPALDTGRTGISSWRAHLLYDDGRVQATEYCKHRTGWLPIGGLEAIVGKHGRLSLSPVVSVMNRSVLIGALKELTDRVNDPKCLYRPGMNLGTEILAYLRHCSTYREWFFVGQVLSMYGSHAGSGTVEAQQRNDLKPLTEGYDVVRNHYYNHRIAKIQHKPKILLVYSDYKPHTEDEGKRLETAMHSWRFHFDNGDMLDFPVKTADLPRSSKDIGDDREMPIFHDLINWAMKFAQPEDVVAYINRDCSLTTHAPERILKSIEKNGGAAVAFRRNIKDPEPGRLYKSVLNHAPDGGFDLFAFTPKWWNDHKSEFPEMYIGRESYDTVLRNLIEEVASGETLKSLRTDFWNNPFYTDDVIWHTDHVPYWQEHKLTSPSQKHNRKVGREFFEKRGNSGMMWALDSAPKPYEKVPPRKRLLELGGFKKVGRT